MTEPNRKRWSVVEVVAFDAWSVAGHSRRYQKMRIILAESRRRLNIGLYPLAQKNPQRGNVRPIFPFGLKCRDSDAV